MHRQPTETPTSIWENRRTSNEVQGEVICGDSQFNDRQTSYVFSE